MVETLDLISNPVILRLKMDLKDDFRHKNGWGIRFMSQFELKTSGSNGFWSKREREREREKRLEREGVI